MPSRPMPSAEPDACLNRRLRWRRPRALRAPEPAQAWLSDNGSLTRRLQALGRFRVAPQYQAMAVPRPEEQRLLGLPPRQRALIREVLLYLDDTPVVFARSVLPVESLTGANRVLGHMARRSLGAELFRAPRAERRAVWYARYPGALLPAGTDADGAWGRQSRFEKRGHPLLVSEVFLPALWQRLQSDVH